MRHGALTFDGTAGNYASYANTAPAGADVIDLRVLASLDDWTPTSDNGVLGAVQNRCYLRINATTGIPQMGVQRTTLITAAATVAPTVTNGSRIWLRSHLVISTGLCTFYTSDEIDLTGHQAVTWSQLGDVVDTGSTVAHHATITPIGVGQQNTATNRPMTGKVYAGAFIFDAAVHEFDFTTLDGLVSAPTDYSDWGNWTLTGAAWAYSLPQLYPQMGSRRYRLEQAHKAEGNWYPNIGSKAWSL